MDYMRQIKIQQFQSKIDKIKKENTYEKACNFIYRHVNWFYDNYDELKREIISADMIYEENNAAYSHNEVNYEAYIILEVKQYYVFIYYEYDYNHDSYSTRIQIIRKDQKPKPNLMNLTESFVEDNEAYENEDSNEKITYYDIEYRDNFKVKSARKLISECKSNLCYIKDSFIKKLVIGLSFVCYSNKLTENQTQPLYEILCSDINDEYSGSGEEKEESVQEEEESE